MNDRGQFSIIAALLVAIILIGTVIITYSTIRNSPIQDRPQVLSAIDEVNFALKQILGFTVGYYGSVLKVTGNSSYARVLAMRYLHSGLVNIANMHPEWGPSFNIEGSGLHAYWFANISYSGGNLAIKYNLTGLGIYGLSYETSCRLMVQTQKTVSSNQAQLAVTKDEGEPLINLGKQNFRFYRYVCENSTWKLIAPSIEPVAFANGTYIIDIPSGIDPYSYVIQVKDARGLIVVASSFNRYTCVLEWNSRELTRYAVTGSTPEITGAPDGNYATIGKGSTCEVTGFQGGTGTIKQVYFNILYYSPVSGTLAWAYQLDGGGWIDIEDLEEGGNPASPLSATYDATSLRASWTWSNLNTTDIQFQNNDKEDAYVDAMYVTVVVQTAANYSALQDATIVVELMQDGTMRWLGQDLQLTAQAKPIPPIPVKSIRINQTINNVNREVPFQVEDWASDYRIPLGLTNNASIFSGRTMLVFLASPNVSKVTVWWNGSDTATQTPYAYTNRYFTGDDTSNGILTNQILTLNVITSGSEFRIESKLGTSENTARFMQINDEWSIYGADPAYVIHHGIVRDIIHQEAEWGSGAPDCPDLYAHIVLTLPANATYYTYQLRLMFVESQQNRNIDDLCLLRLRAEVSRSKWGPDWSKIITENGTSAGLPLISYNEGFFYNLSNVWQHHWTELVENNHGFGIMTTSQQNLQLYVLDQIAGDKTGGIRISDSRSWDYQTVEIRIKPVSLSTVSFTHALDQTWCGAVVTFDGEKPIYPDNGGTTGLWITVEYPPAITITTEN